MSDMRFKDGWDGSTNRAHFAGVSYTGGGKFSVRIKVPNLDKGSMKFWYCTKDDVIALLAGMSAAENNTVPGKPVTLHSDGSWHDKPEIDIRRQIYKEMKAADDEASETKAATPEQLSKFITDHIPEHMQGPIAYLLNSLATNGQAPGITIDQDLFGGAPKLLEHQAEGTEQ